jgi:hypothetical protein
MAKQNSGRVPTLGALAERTQLSWAKRIPSYAEVPGAYQDFFEPLRMAGQDMPYTVLAPSYEGFLHRAAEKLVCAFGQEVHILEGSGSTFEAKSFPLAGISYVEVRAVLLNSHIKIYGLTDQGVPSSATLRFNTVTDYLFRPIVKRIRLGAGEARLATPRSEGKTFDHLVRVNYKFMNYARQSLLAEETAIHAILQPEIREGVLSVLGKTYYRTISPTHMSILTDGELITIREEVGWGGKERYGGVWDYVPVDKIVSLSLSEKGSSLLNLSIQLPEGARLDSLFQASARQDLEQLLDHVKKLITSRCH